MITSVQKRRNFSKDISFQNKLLLNRHHISSYALNSYQNISLLKERNLNKPLANSQTEDNLIKKRTSLTPFKYNQQLVALDTKFASFSSKIKNLLKSQQEGQGKENSPIYQSINISTVEKNKSGLIRRSELYFCRELERPIANFPYFIQCLRRKSMISTQTCMHIHNSLMTFKQFYRSVQSIKAKLPDPKMPPQTENRKTIVFDMDQTLIHTNQLMIKGYELKVPFKSIQGKVISGYVHVRPHAKQIIRNISKYFDVVVFTAGNQCYADPILDHIDPDRCIKYRLYRQSCTSVNNQLFVKDLRVLGRKLQSVVLVDNAPHSYMMQLSNGIPILNYIKGKDDDQLVKLQTYLMTLLDVSDVRTANIQTFRLQDYLKYDNYDRLIQELYGKWL